MLLAPTLPIFYQVRGTEILRRCYATAWLPLGPIAVT